jgi:ABC-2 type transport system permease protein
VFSTLVPITLLIFAIAAGARAIGGSEDDGTLELLLASPIATHTRGSRALHRRRRADCRSGVITTVVTLFALAAPFDLLKGISIVNLFTACAAATCLALVHASIAFTVGAAFGGRGRAIAVASAVAVAGYLLFGLVSSDVIRLARFADPWYWYLNHNIVAAGIGLEAWLLPLCLSVLFTAAGVWRFALRDLR